MFARSGSSFLPQPESVIFHLREVHIRAEVISTLLSPYMDAASVQLYLRGQAGPCRAGVGGRLMAQYNGQKRAKRMALLAMTKLYAVIFVTAVVLQAELLVE